MLTVAHRLLAVAFCTLVASAFLSAGGMSASAGNFGAPPKVTAVNRFLAGNPPQPYNRYPSVNLGGVNRFLSGNQAQPYNSYSSVNLGGANRFLSGNQAQPYQGYASVPLGGVNKFLSGN